MYFSIMTVVCLAAKNGSLSNNRRSGNNDIINEEMEHLETIYNRKFDWNCINKIILGERC
jgi:hypothetical protein